VVAQPHAMGDRKWCQQMEAQQVSACQHAVRYATGHGGALRKHALDGNDQYDEVSALSVIATRTTVLGTPSNSEAAVCCVKTFSAGDMKNGEPQGPGLMALAITTVAQKFPGQIAEAANEYKLGMKNTVQPAVKATMKLVQQKLTDSTGKSVFNLAMQNQTGNGVECTFSFNKDATPTKRKKLFGDADGGGAAQPPITVIGTVHSSSFGEQVCPRQQWAWNLAAGTKALCLSIHLDESYPTRISQSVTAPRRDAHMGAMCGPPHFMGDNPILHTAQARGIARIGSDAKRDRERRQAHVVDLTGDDEAAGPAPKRARDAARVEIDLTGD